jgi:hypothetical protein
MLKFCKPSVRGKFWFSGLIGTQLGPNLDPGGKLYADPCRLRSETQETRHYLLVLFLGFQSLVEGEMDDIGPDGGTWGPTQAGDHHQLRHLLVGLIIVVLKSRHFISFTMLPINLII